MAKKIADKRAEDKQNIEKNKIKQREELIKIINKIELFYKNNKEVSIYDDNLINIFDSAALISMELDDFNSIEMLEKKYPEFNKYIFKKYKLYKITNIKEKNKIKKYKKRYQYLIIISSILLTLIVLLGAVLWSTI